MRLRSAYGGTFFDGAGPRVLVVDDVDHVREMLVEMLELDGFEVTGQARSGDEAVAMALTQAPDVAVVDLRMPGIDGLETTRQLRAIVTDLPVIIYTAYLDDGVAQAALEAGAAACLAKIDGLPALERELVRLTAEPRADHHPEPRAIASRRGKRSGS